MPTFPPSSSPSPTPPRRLCLVLGDQLWMGNPALADFDPAHDRVLMVEAASEATHVWSHQARIALFLAAMRHFCNALHRAGWPYHYVALDDDPLALSFQERLEKALRWLQPESLWVCEPGEWRMLEAVQRAASSAGIPVQVCFDTHFACSTADFQAWAAGQRAPRMEFFYRRMRAEHGVLMAPPDAAGRVQPLGGRWNFDRDNRKGYGRNGPGAIPPPPAFEPDRVTREVLKLVGARFGGHPGQLDAFAWPITREQALQALDAFVAHRLPHFGPQQDAMWTDTPWGWHAILSSSLNLRLLDPLEVVRAAEAAFHAAGHAPNSGPGQALLASVEGFIRQVLGWREYIRGMYWLDMPAMAEANHFDHHRDLPAWYWTGKTHMRCMQACIGQTLRYGFAHHIQRLMVTGQFALLAQVEPRQVCDWYLAVYVDAVEWVELPNTACMALHADGGRLASKPYVASGQYIKRMSNYCDGCRYDPAQRHGEGACPVTTLYWHFLDTHEAALLHNPRTAPMVRNLARLGDAERGAIRAQAAHVLAGLADL